MKKKTSTPSITPTYARLGMTAQTYADSGGEISGPIIGMGKDYCVFRVAAGGASEASNDYDRRLGNPVARRWSEIELINVQPDPAQVERGKAA